MKTCSKCKRDKTVFEFYLKKKNSNEVRPQCKNCTDADNRKWAVEHRVEQCGIVKRWNKKNRAAISAKEKLRYHKDLGYKLKKILRSRLTTVLKRKKVDKSRSAVLDFLGCPIVWLEAYLEEQFQGDMTWENIGRTWHVDHIRPCASFNLSELEQQRICFHWTNLQPLFVTENLQKGARYAAAN